MNNAKVIAICNHKGGVAKTVTTNCLGVSLANAGKKVLLVDFDPQGNLTKGLGFTNRTMYRRSIKDAINDELNDNQLDCSEYTVRITRNADLIPANIDFAGFELQLVSMMNRENVLKRTLEKFKGYYDYILIDSTPTLNLFTINALAVADSIIIPVQAEPSATDGLSDLLNTIHLARKQLNPNLQIEGILITMTDARTNLSKHISKEIRNYFKDNIKVFDTEIPRNVKIAEATLHGESPITYAPECQASRAYQSFRKEVLKNEPTITKSKPVKSI